MITTYNEFKEAADDLGVDKESLQVVIDGFTMIKLKSFGTPIELTIWRSTIKGPRACFTRDVNLAVFKKYLKAYVNTPR